LARSFGPALGGWLYASLGPRAPYAAASAGMLVALALSALLHKSQARTNLSAAP
jgi:predicted MFS family arabinose efflux permease